MPMALGALQQRRDAATIIRHSFGYVFSRPGPFVLFGVAAIPASLLGLGFGLAFRDPLPGIVVSVILAPVISGLNSITNGLSAGFVAGIDRDNASVSAQINSTLDAASDLFFSAARATIITTLLMFSILGSPWAFSRTVRWAFITQAVVVDGANSESALDRSSTVVRGNWWRTLGRLLLAYLVVAPVSVPAALAGFLYPDELPLRIAASCVAAAIAPYLAIASTLMYSDLKLRKAEEAPAT